MSEAIRVLIIGDGNSARSQMAEGLLRHDAGHRFEVHSAGTHPSGVDPLAVEAMREIGIDISGHRSKSVDEFAGQSFEFVVTVCDAARARIPYFAGWAERVDWSIDDPRADGEEAECMAAFGRVRDEMREKLDAFFGPFAGGQTSIP
jgi:arsenate reductase